MWWVRVGSFAIGVVIAAVVSCGGRTRIDGLGDAPSVSAGTGGADGISVAGSRPDTSTGGSMSAIGGAAAVAGSGSGGSMAGSGASASMGGSGAGAVTGSNLGNSCPQALGNRSCSAIELDISFSGAAEDPRTKFWIEPLQIPDYSQGISVNQPKLDPSSGIVRHCPRGRACCVSMGFRAPVCSRALCSSALARLTPTRTPRMSFRSATMRLTIVERASRPVVRARPLLIGTAIGGISSREAKTPIWSCARPSAEVRLAAKSALACVRPAQADGVLSSMSTS
jgi:hypothetical protein